jgi:protein-glutamine gamma-glutamyltransferase
VSGPGSGGPGGRSSAATPALPFLGERLTGVGTLALVAPLPLFFSYSLELGLLALYGFAIGFLLLRAKQGRAPRLSNAVLNVAGLLYLPVFVLDFRYGSHTLLRSTLHLLLFTTVMKLASVRRERDLSACLVLAGFLFVAAVGTSFHVSILAFVAVFTLLAWRVLVRWSIWRDLAAAPEEWSRDPRAREIPGRRPLLASVATVLALAAPFFLFLPRLRAPYVRGLPAGQDLTTGFSDVVDPDLHGLLKRSDRVLARITAGRALNEGDAELLRLRTAAFTRWDGRVWTHPEGKGRYLPAGGGALVPVSGRRGAPVSEADALAIDLLPLGSRYVPYPLRGTALRFAESNFRGFGGGQVERDDVRNLRLLYEPDRTLRYAAFLAAGPEPDLAPGARTDDLAAPDSDVLRRVARERTAGIDAAADPEAAARALAAWLKGPEFAYSLDPVPPTPRPVEAFLTERRRGHCQAFATAMALLLRELGVPTRFVTGFVGGEIGPFGQYVLVRGENVHAWVEAWCGAKGWITFDPTPASGVPDMTRVSLLQRFRQVADGVEFFFDRFVLGFSQNDQVELIRRAREALDAVAGTARRTVEILRGLVSSLPGSGRVPGAIVAAALGAILAAGLGFFLRRALPGFGTRSLPPASAAYRKLQRALARRGARLTPAAAPAETLKAAASFGPAAKAPAEKIVLAYVRESFSGQSDREANADLLAEWLADFRSAIRVEGVRGNPA